MFKWYRERKHSRKTMAYRYMELVKEGNRLVEEISAAPSSLKTLDTYRNDVINFTMRCGQFAGDTLAKQGLITSLLFGHVGLTHVSKLARLMDEVQTTLNGKTPFTSAHY